MSETTDRDQITRLLHDWRQGEESAREELFSLLYRELRSAAAIQLRKEGRGRPSLQPTGLVAEAFLRLVDAKVNWQNRAHFLALSARVMRRVLIERHRRRSAEKRGGGQAWITLREDLQSPSGKDVEIESLDHALTRLEKLHPRQAAIVELRFFAGLEVKEVAEVLGVSVATVKRDWSVARLWLYRELDTKD